MDTKAEKLVKDNEGLVYRIYFELFNRYRNCGYMREDLIQEGMVSLWKATKTFDEDRGIKFSTYASNCVHNRMLNCIRLDKKRLSDVSIHTIVSTMDGEPIEILDTIIDINTSGEYEESDLYDSVRHVLKTESVRNRKIFYQYLRGCSYEEITKMYDLKPRIVDNVILIIRNKVRKKLGTKRRRNHGTKDKI